MYRGGRERACVRSLETVESGEINSCAGGTRGDWKQHNLGRCISVQQKLGWPGNGSPGQLGPELSLWWLLSSGDRPSGDRGDWSLGRPEIFGILSVALGNQNFLVFIPGGV